MHIRNSSICADRVDIDFSGHEVVVQIDIKGSNLPILFDLSVTSDENKYIGFHYRSVLAYSSII